MHPDSVERVLLVVDQDHYSVVVGLMMIEYNYHSFWLAVLPLLLWLKMRQR